MLIGVVSDTHDYIRAARLAARIFVQRNVGLVVHLGDIVAPFTLRAIHQAGVRKLVAVYGNNDGERVLLTRTAEKLGFEIHEWPYIIEVDGRRVALVHGIGSPDETVRIVEALAPGVDIVLYGHTHRREVRRLGSTLIVNPGEACGCLTGVMTAAIIDTERMTAEMIELGHREDHL